MNDMELLRRWGSRLDPPTAAPPPSVRARALRRSPARRGRTPRIAWSLPLSAALALTVAAVFVWSGTGRDVDAPPDNGRAAPATLSADQILRHAAVLVARETEVAPRADQFVFTEHVYTGPTTHVDGNDKEFHVPAEPQVRQAWNSVDGTRDGLLKGRSAADRDWTLTETIHVCRNGTMNGETMPCVTVPQVLPGLPTDAGAMLEYLYAYRGTKSAGGDRNVAAFAAGLDLFERYYLTPATKAAVFEALSRLPGVTTRENVVDVAGRPGVAVRMAGSAATLKAAELILDPKTYTFLGTASLAVLRQAIVNQPGELP